jgi:hypothetical protein
MGARDATASLPLTPHEADRQTASQGLVCCALPFGCDASGWDETRSCRRTSGRGRAVEVDEAAARRSAARPIARLERQLGDALISAFPQVAIDVRVPAPARGPRLLSLAQLEEHRDALAAKLREARMVLEQRGAEVEGNRVCSSACSPTRAATSSPACTAPTSTWAAAAPTRSPRLGIIGMLAGWWHDKLSSGCPLSHLDIRSALIGRQSQAPVAEPPARRAASPAAQPPAHPRKRARGGPQAPWHPFPLVELAILPG